LTLPNLVDAGHFYMSTLRLAEEPTYFSALVSRGVVTRREAPGLSK